MHMTWPFLRIPGIGYCKSISLELRIAKLETVKSWLRGIDIDDCTRHFIDCREECKDSCQDNLLRVLGNIDWQGTNSPTTRTQGPTRKLWPQIP